MGVQQELFETKNRPEGKGFRVVEEADGSISTYSGDTMLVGPNVSPLTTTVIDPVYGGATQLVGTTPYPVAQLQYSLITAFAVPLLPPAGFGWVSPIQFLRWGYDVFAVYNASEWMAVTTQTLYVNHTTGNDTTGAGTLAAPYLSIDKAISAMTAASTIWVAGGPSNRNTCWKGRSPAYDCNVLASEEGVVSSTRWEGGALTDLGNGAWGGARASIGHIIDDKFKNKNGYGQRLQKVSSQAEVIASTTGAYWTDNVNFAFRTQDGRALDGDIKILLDVANGRLSTDKKVYVRGVSFEGGGAGAFAATDAVGGATISTNACVVLDSLDLRYAAAVAKTDGNGLTILGCPLTLAVNVRSYGNQADGLNYHVGGGNGIQPRFIELGCVSFGNGYNSGSNDDNASTSHDSSIGIRLRTVGGDSVGPVFADVNNAKTWNIQCISTGSAGTIGAYGTVGFFSLDTATQWLDECVSYGAGSSVYKAAGAFQYARNCNLPGANPTRY